MGLNEVLARSAVARVSVLIVEVPGWSRARCAVEAEIRRRGWRPALSPADADALVVCGRPGRRLLAAVDLVWSQVPGPRARITLPAASAVVAGLDRLPAELADDARQRQDAAARSTDPDMGTPAAEGDESDDDESDGDMDMPMPGGIPLAGGADDRDGLEMDVLHVPLGPVLPAWPSGLVLRCTVSGDVVTDAEAEVLEPDGPAPVEEALVQGSPPDRLDRAARLLALAGWEAAATAGARLRDDILAAGEPANLLPELDRLAGRVSRSRLLRWSVSGRGRSQPPDPFEALLGLFRDARAALTGSPGPLSPTTLGELAELVVGRQLPAVRLMVTAAELDTATSVRAGVIRR